MAKQIGPINYKKYLSEKRSCIICNNNNFRLWGKADIFDVVQCINCGLVFVNPCLNEEGLGLVYLNHHNKRIKDIEECDKREEMYQIDRDFLLEIIDEGKILDIGCGGGFFLDKFNSKKWKRYGLEIDKDTTLYAKENFDTDVYLWDSKTIPFEDNLFNVVVFRGSFEHMINPHLVAVEVKRVLKSNGYFYICATPNVESFCAKIYRENWNQFDAKEHIFMFSLKTLKKIVEPLGFKTAKTAYFYEETPYCSIENDIAQVIKDYQLYKEGKQGLMNISPPFWGNMLNVIFKKTSA